MCDVYKFFDFINILYLLFFSFYIPSKSPHGGGAGGFDTKRKNIVSESRLNFCEAALTEKCESENFFLSTTKSRAFLNPYSFVKVRSFRKRILQNAYIVFFTLYTEFIIYSSTQSFKSVRVDN